jgi:hypothetical protein
MKTTRNLVMLALSFSLTQFLATLHADDLPEPPHRASLPEASTQSSGTEFERDVRQQGYIFGGAGSMSNVGSALYELGGGYDWIFYRGLGLGAEASLLGDQSTGIVTGGVQMSYHFLPDSPGIEPFVVGGMSFGGAPEYGLSGYTWANAGGGFNYWFHNGMALRVEVRGRLDVEYDDDMVLLRVGLTF